ncbi:hypothetical protein [Desulfobacter postgatei]|uniref:hypothetical protein n=1 Tax=Desulfobacter postgatei TaxID=2293 RepID=UPI00259B925C|nr:hypothetical protein [uncultured Desulfobacter sp.]
MTQVMCDIKMMQDQVDGLIAKGKALRIKEAVFLKVQGINEEIEKTNQERSGYAEDLEKAKTRRDGLISKKNNAVSEAAGQIAEKMKAVLPVGDAVFDITDSVLTIGWKVDKKFTPYNGLSGAQKQIFDGALAHVLDANIIVLEAAELDHNHLLASLEDLSKLDAQVIVNTCHPVEVVPEPFVKIDLGKVAA